jgi:hypothetical protein
MNRLFSRLLACSSIVFCSLPRTSAHAQEVPRGSADTQAVSQLDPHLKPATRRFESPERFMFEARGGPYSVFSGKSYGDYFSTAVNFGAQLDGIVYRIPRVVYVTVGGSIGRINFSGHALETATGTPTGEETTLSLVPLTATASIHLDVLPRRLGIPILLGARAGWEWAHWDTNTGKTNDASGWSLGPVVSAQVALDLDSFEPGGARALDEEWGINHTYLFGELFHFAATSKSLPIGATSWLLGLGFVF